MWVSSIYFLEPSEIWAISISKAKADIIYFNDSMVDTPPIGKEDYFYRWTVSVSKAKNKRAKVVKPVRKFFPLHSASTTTKHLKIPRRGCIRDCPGVYDAHVDIQRFCVSCRRWYHVMCLTSHKRTPPPYTINGAPLPSHVKAVNVEGFMRVCKEPIERGSDAGLVGNGELIMKAHNMLYEGSVGGDWMDVLGQRAVLKILSVRKPSLFHCPKCEHMYI